jgi:hypothetical protein
LAFDVAEITQRATGCFHLRIGLRRAQQQNAQPREPCRLLRTRRERPRRRRAAEQRQELAPPHVEHQASSRPTTQAAAVGRFTARSGCHSLTDNSLGLT